MMAEFELGVAGTEVLLSSCDCEMDIAPEQIARQVRTAKGDLKQDLVATKRKFRFDYDWLPGKAAHVADGGMGRDELYALYVAGGALSLHLPSEALGVEDVSVMFEAGSWSEKLLLRDTALGWVWAAAFTLVEV